MASRRYNNAKDVTTEIKRHLSRPSRLSHLRVKSRTRRRKEQKPSCWRSCCMSTVGIGCCVFMVRSAIKRAVYAGARYNVLARCTPHPDIAHEGVYETLHNIHFSIHFSVTLLGKISDVFAVLTQFFFKNAVKSFSCLSFDPWRMPAVFERDKSKAL